MKTVLSLSAMGIVIVGALLCGCFSEVIDPEIKIVVLDVMTTNLSAGSPREVAANGSEYVYVKMNVTNENEKVDKIFTSDMFKAEDASRNPLPAVSLANLEERENTFTLKPGESRDFYAVFLVPNNVDLTLLVGKMGTDEDVTAEIPDYDHF